MTQLAIFSDIHMRDGHQAAIERELSTAIDNVANGQPDHAFVLGDLIEDGGSASVDETNLERVHEIFSAAPFPVTYLLGNHDVENVSKDRLTALLDQEGFTGVIDRGDSSVIFLDSTIEGPAGARGELGPDQRGWLAEILPQHPRPLILCHHPLGNFDLRANEWFKDYPERAFCADRKELLEVLEQRDEVLGSISGHIHQTGCTEFHGMTHVSVNAFSKESQNKPLTGTYAAVSISDDVTIDVKVRDDITASFTLR